MKIFSAIAILGYKATKDNNDNIKKQYFSALGMGNKNNFLIVVDVHLCKVVCTTNNCKT
jgi:hypothetical protein